jgi:hypothetical protein
LVGFSRIFLLGILIFKGFTARHLYKSFGVKGLILSLIFFTRFLLLAAVSAGHSEQDLNESFPSFPSGLA